MVWGCISSNETSLEACNGIALCSPFSCQMCLVTINSAVPLASSSKGSSKLHISCSGFTVSLLLPRYFSFWRAVNKVKVKVTELLLTQLCLYCSRSSATQVACGPPLHSAVPFGQVISTVAFPSPLQQMRCQALISWVVKTPRLLLLHPLLPLLPILLKTWDRPTILGEFGAQQLEEEVQIPGLIHTTLMKTKVKQKERTFIQVMIQL